MFLETLTSFFCTSCRLCVSSGVWQWVASSVAQRPVPVSDFVCGRRDLWPCTHPRQRSHPQPSRPTEDVHRRLLGWDSRTTSLCSVVSATFCSMLFTPHVSRDKLPSTRRAVTGSNPPEASPGRAPSLRHFTHYNSEDEELIISVSNQLFRTTWKHRQQQQQPLSPKTRGKMGNCQLMTTHTHTAQLSAWQQLLQDDEELVFNKPSPFVSLSRSEFYWFLFVINCLFSSIPACQSW